MGCSAASSFRVGPIVVGPIVAGVIVAGVIVAGVIVAGEIVPLGWNHRHQAIPQDHFRRLRAGTQPNRLPHV